MTDKVISLFKGDGNTAAASLELPQDPTFDQWSAIGSRLFSEASRLQWQIGDWWAAGARFNGRQRCDLVDGWGVDHHTCENYAVVARAFVGSRRRESLSFAHHAELTRLPADEADELLDWCEAKTLEDSRPCTRGELRAHRSAISTFNTMLAKREAESQKRPIFSIVGHEETPAPNVVLKRASRAEPASLVLVTSDPVLPDLAAPDRIAIAKAALAALSFPDQRRVIVEFIRELSPGQQEDLLAAL